MSKPYYILLLLFLVSCAPDSNQKQVTALEKYVEPPGVTNGYGCIDTTGKVVVPFIYDHIGRPVDGWMTAQKNGKWGFIDLQGKTVIPFIYEDVQAFADGMASVRKNGKHGFINKKGEVIIPIEFDSAMFEFREDLAWVKKGAADGKYGAYDKTGKLIFPFEFKGYKYIGEGVYQMQKKAKYGLMNKNGEEITPFVFNSFKGDRDGLSITLKKGGYGLLNLKGEEIIPFMHYNITFLGEGLIFTARNDKDDPDGESIRSLVNYKGELVAEMPLYTSVERFSEGLSRLTGAKVRYMNTKGETVTPEYDSGSNFKGGVETVRKGEKFGLINKEGKLMSA